MTAHQATKPATGSPRMTLGSLRVVMAMLVASVLAQPVLGGLYLAGNTRALDLHERNFFILLLLLIGQTAIATVHAFRGGQRRLAPAFAFLTVAVYQQAVLGYARDLGLHIPIGVLIVTVTVVLAGWLFSRRAVRPRPRGNPRRRVKEEACEG